MESYAHGTEVTWAECRCNIWQHVRDTAMLFATASRSIYERLLSHFQILDCARCVSSVKDCRLDTFAGLLEDESASPLIEIKIACFRFWILTCAIEPSLVSTWCEQARSAPLYFLVFLRGLRHAPCASFGEASIFLVVSRVGVAGWYRYQRSNREQKNTEVYLIQRGNSPSHTTWAAWLILRGIMHRCCLHCLGKLLPTQQNTRRWEPKSFR